MNSSSGLDFLFDLTDFGIKLGLDKTLGLLKEFGNPHLKIPSVLIAGTNGKGSVARALAHILTESGYRTGLYTSPHLVEVNERIVFNGDNIGTEELTALAFELQALLADRPEQFYPTFFEALTTLAFKFFADKKADIIIAEVGMGGRFDATNVLPSFLEIITRVSLDHTQFLGKSYQEVASEKAGIIKPGSRVISARQREEVLRVIEGRARLRGAELLVFGRDFHARRVAADERGQTFSFYGDVVYRNLVTSMLGRHQVENMSLAVQASILVGEAGFRVGEAQLYSALGSLLWRARLQVLSRSPLIVLDGAHNPEGMSVLARSLKEIFPGRRFSFLVGVMRDKDWKKMLRKIFACGPEMIVFTAPTTERALELPLLAGYAAGKGIEGRIIPDVKEAYGFITSQKKDWAVCGSLYLCGDILEACGDF